ncbi:DUF3046 domain-containing protein [Spongisporangium articulatum]|uniref:DUF3046 domain-containing protein n=1 Tax=Spongisporangium articulatum TaxID=3362603 RepID=A0ABW8AMM2_9ACTN
MRQSEFWNLVDGEFGAARGRLLAREHVLLDLGGRTAEQALADGDPPVRDVWFALARSLDVPQSRIWGSDDAPPRSRGR